MGSVAASLSAADVRKMWGTAERIFVRHACQRNPCLLWNPSIHSLPPYQKLEVPESGSTLHQLCIMLASCPSLRRSWRKKPVSYREAKGLVRELCSPRFVTYNAVIVLSVVLCDCCKPMNTCRDWAFSIRGLEVGLPAFQMPMFAKCEALPKGDLLDMFV